MTRETAVVFGTGSLARAFCAKMPADLDILAFADNDVRRQGTSFEGRPVVAPAAIPALDPDAVIVASCFHEEISTQLTSLVGLAPEKIRRCPKGLQNPHKSLHPFAHEPTRALGEQLLFAILDVLAERGVRCYVDHGTLLGFVRDGGLMPWDDDIDLSVLESDRDRVLDAVPTIAARLPCQNEVRWSGHFMRQRKGKLLGVTFVFEVRAGAEFKPVPAAVWFTSFRNGFAEQFINLAPEHHFQSAEFVTFKGRRLAVPADWDAYLTFHYGDWRTPKRDIRFAEISNYRKHEIAVERIPFEFDALAALRDRDPDERIERLRESFVARAAAGEIEDVHHQPWIGRPENVVHGKTLLVVPTSVCHPECPGCRAHTPYVTAALAPGFVPAEEITSDLSKLAQMIAVNVVRLDGGEPALHPELPRLLEDLSRSGIGDRVELTTSGVVPLSREALDTCRGRDVTVRIVEYGLPEHAPAVASTIRACEEHGVRFKHRVHPIRVDSWSDWGGLAKTRDVDDRVCHERFRRCRRNAAWTLARGRFFKCNRAPFDQWTGVHGAHDADSIDLRSHGTVQERCERLRAYLVETTFLEACRTCAGHGTRDGDNDVVELQGGSAGSPRTRALVGPVPRLVGAEEA